MALMGYSFKLYAILVPRKTLFPSAGLRQKSGQYRQPVQSHVFGQAEHHIHVLHRLARGAFGEVVLNDQDQGPIGARLVHREPQGIGAAHRAGFRRTARGQHIDERLFRIERGVQRLQVEGLPGGREAGRQGGMHAANHGGEMRHEQAVDRAAAGGRARDAAQLFVDFRPMPVPFDAVGLEIVRSFAEQQTDFRLAARARNPRGAVGHEVGGLHEAGGAQQGGKAQLHRGGIAAGIGNNTGLGNGLAVQFRQAVNRLLQQIGAGVLHAVPLGELGQVLQAEVGGQIDKAHTGIEQPPGLSHGHPVRRGEKDDVAGVQRCVVRRGEGKIDLPAQAGEHIGHRGARFLARGDGGQLGLGVAGQQPQQLHPGVAGTANDANAQTFHGAGPLNESGHLMVFVRQGAGHD